MVIEVADQLFDRRADFVRPPCGQGRSGFSNAVDLESQAFVFALSPLQDVGALLCRLRPLAERLRVDRVQIGDIGRQVQGGSERLWNGPDRGGESFPGFLPGPPVTLDQRLRTGGGRLSHARRLVLPGGVLSQLVGDVIVLGQAFGGLLARCFQRADQRVPRGKRGVRGWLDLPRQRLPGVPESSLRRVASLLGVGDLALDAFALRVECVDLAACFSRGVVRRLGDLLRLGQSLAVGCFPAGREVAPADGAGIPRVEIVGGGRRRLGAPCDGQMLVGAGRLGRRETFLLSRAFQPSRALRFLGPKRIELLADSVDSRR